MPVVFGATTNTTDLFRDKNLFAENYASDTSSVIADIVRTGIINTPIRYRGMINIDLSSLSITRPWVNVSKIEIKHYQFANSGSGPPPSTIRGYESNSYTCSNCVPGTDGPPYTSCSCAWANMCSANGLFDILVDGDSYTASSPCNNNSYTSQEAPGVGNYTYWDITNLYNTDPDKNFALIFLYPYEKTSAAGGSNYQDYDLHDSSSDSGFFVTYINDLPEIDACNVTTRYYRGDTAVARLYFTDATPPANMTSTLEYRGPTGGYSGATFVGNGSNYHEYNFTVLDQVGDFDLRCFVNDTYNTTTSEFLDTFNTVNRAPSVALKNIATAGTDPAHDSLPEPNENLLMKGGCTDPDIADRDASDLSLYYNVYKNNVLQSTYTGSTSATHDVNVTAITVPENETRSAQNWTLEIRCADAFIATGNESSSIALINGSLPTTTINITPSSPLETQDLTCENSTLIDTDGQTVTIQSYEWYRNGTDQNIDNKILGNGNLTAGDLWNCSLVLNDTTQINEIFSLNTVTILTANLPSINISSPTNGSSIERDVITDNVTITIQIGGDVLDSCWHNHYNSTGFPTTDVFFNCNATSFDITTTFFGTHTLDVTINDTNSLTDSETLIWTIQETTAGGGGGGGGGEEPPKEEPLSQEGIPTCGIDIDDDGILCDSNEDWLSCPDDCSAPNLDNLLCLEPDKCLWKEAWFLKITFGLLLFIIVLLLYLDYNQPKSKRKILR